MAGTRIDFKSADAARFNALRDEWRGAASSCALSRAGLRIANVLPQFVSREFGYAFPTDEDLAAAVTASIDTAKRGLVSLEEKDLIERKTRVKRDDKNEAVGRERRIFLTMPEVKVQKAPEVKVQEVKVQPEVKVQKRGGEGAPVPSNIPDRTTPDSFRGSGDRKVGSHARTQAPARPHPYATPKAFGDDHAFLDAFDGFVVELTGGGDIGAGEIERITSEAFNRATDSDEMFMPFHWPEVCALRDSSVAEWFRYRAGALVHRRAA